MNTSFYDQEKNVTFQMRFLSQEMVIALLLGTQLSYIIYLRASGVSCTLPQLPYERWYHTMENSGLLCGGGVDP